MRPTATPIWTAWISPDSAFRPVRAAAAWSSPMWSFGETVPRERVDRVNAGLMAADAVLVVGSSLMVYSGYRFVAAAARGMPIAAINLGRTRADALLTLKVEQPCAQALDAL